MTQRVAMITGGASGIGLAIAARLGQDGCKVVIVDVDAAAGAAAAAGIDGHFLPADLSRRADCRRVVEEARSLCGPIDILINNAGFQKIDAIDVFDEDVWDRMLAVMLTAPFLLIRYAWPDMKARGRGRVVNISSIMGKVGAPFKAGYVSAKHGLIGLTRAAALEGGEHGITVNAVCPAFVRTPLVEKQIADQARTRGLALDQVVRDVMLAPAAIKRLIEPSEVADLVAYLCSDAAAAVTGADWTIDVGWTAV